MVALFQKNYLRKIRSLYCIGLGPNGLFQRHIKFREPIYWF